MHDSKFRKMNNSEVLKQLGEILEQRKGAAPDSSYVASLYDKGLDEQLIQEKTEGILIRHCTLAPLAEVMFPYQESHIYF